MTTETPILDEVLDMSNVASPIDRRLLRAALLTMVWDPRFPASKPAIVITSEYGPGTGKTRTAKLLGMVAEENAPVIYFNTTGCHIANVSWMDGGDDKCSTLILDGVNEPLRAKVLQMITAELVTFGGMDRPPTTRPNFFNWIIVAEPAAISADLADRSIIIQLGQPVAENTRLYERWAAELKAKRIPALRDELIMLACNESLDHGRWRHWNVQVLGTDLANAAALMEHIESRRRQLNADEEGID